MKEQLTESFKDTLKELNVDCSALELDFPENPKHGDFTTNIALISAKKMGANSKILAEKIVEQFKKDMPDFVESVEVAGAGFINFKIKGETVAKEVVRIAKSEENHKEPTSEKQVLVEYTDPNIFKPFHIGHLMANAIGESISRLIEYSGLNIIRICYPADIGLHIAKSIWAMQKNLDNVPADAALIQEKIIFLGKMYVLGTKAYDEDPIVKSEIDALNRVIYEKSDQAVEVLYDKGRKWSLEHFDLLYKRLDTHFDDYIYESEMAPVGLKIVKEFLKKGIFEESEGAVIFKGEKYGLHTRVFINSLGLPIYEAKDMGLNMTKFEKYPKTDRSIIITANEQNDYFKVIIKALSLIDANIGARTSHIGHGMLRFVSGKMSSRKGNVISAEALIGEIKDMVREKMGENRDDEIADEIAIGAIKYTILRQAIGGDIIFDSVKSISFEGDSGPYLQYSAVRAASILKKAGIMIPSAATRLAKPFRCHIGTGGAKRVAADPKIPLKIGLLERLLIRFPDIVDRARNEYAPQYVANYLIALAGEFNGFYARQVILDEKDPLSPYYVAITKAFFKVMAEGLWLLGIKVPKRM